MIGGQATQFEQFDSGADRVRRPEATVEENSGPEIPAPSAEVREALYELQRYLSDAIAPLMVADSIEILLRAPVQVTAAQIHAWATSQYHGPGANVPMSDYLFHAMKKIHLMGEYELVSRENILRFLQELSRFVMAYCPPEDRQLLRANIGRLGEATTVLSSSVDYLHRQAGSNAQPLAAGAPAGSAASAPLASAGQTAGAAPGVASAAGVVPMTPDLARGLRNFGLLVERLQRVPSGPDGEAPAGPDESREIMSQLMTIAAMNSRNESELQTHFDRLRGLGLPGDGRQLFRDLGRSLPDWTYPMGMEQGVPIGQVGPVEAMHNIIALAEDPNDGAARFREMVQAAVDHFNEGSLGRAATMFDLAERIIVEKKVDYTVVQSVRQRFVGENIETEMLRRFSETPDKYPLLRKVLGFFTPLTVQGLLQNLQVEEKREKRRLALALLEAHGPAARVAAYDWLEIVAQDPGRDPERFFTRNLVYLLRRIPAPDDLDLTEEVDTIVGVLTLDAPSLLSKEVVAYLGQTRLQNAEKGLIDFLAEIERQLIRPRESIYDIQELRQLLDRTVAALARIGSVHSIRAVVAHGLKKQAALGDSMARLTDLGAQDISVDPDSVEKLLKSLKSELPMRLLGFMLQRGAQDAFHIIEALSGTRAPSVRSAFEDIVNRYPDQDFGRAAAKALSGFGAQPKPQETQPAVGLSGDLELFGLPSLLQTLAESNVSGMLTLKDLEGDTVGVIVLEQGKILDGQAGKLRGAEAVYQLFERPAPGTFTFVSRRESAAEKDRTTTALEVVPVVFEAMRRYDEFRQARLMVPDHVSFEISGIRPASHPDEKDPNLSRIVWNKVRSGAIAADCETDVPADSYRVRRLLVHWVEQGALQQI